jgi:NIPSNAP
MRRMNRRTWLQAAPLAVLLQAGIVEAMQRAFPQAAGKSPGAEGKEQGEAMAESAKVYELRIYHVVPGEMESLVARFRDHTDQLFAKHGMKSVAYWTALDEPMKSSTFYYILEHPSREAAAANWKSFRDDPEWQAVKTKSEANGALVESIDSTFLMLTDFSKRLA